MLAVHSKGLPYGSRSRLPTSRAVEVVVVGVVVSLGVDEVGVDRSPAPVAEDPGGLVLQRAGRQILDTTLKLSEVSVGARVVGLAKNQVVVNWLCDVGDDVVHVWTLPSRLVGHRKA